MAAGELLLMVHAEAVGVNIALYRMRGGTYRIRLGGGIGWAPDVFKDRAKAERRLFDTQTYGEREIAMCRPMCRVNP